MSRRPLLPITLGAKRETWRMGDSEHDRDEEFRNIRPKILERDNYTCRFCAFHSRGYQEVHHLDDNHQNNRPENLVTACPFCHSCFHIGFAGLMSEGFLIWIEGENPVPQHVISNIARVIHIGSKIPGLEWMPAILGLSEQIKARMDLCERRFGTSNPLVLGDALLTMTDAEYANRGAALRNVRYFPGPRRYNIATDIWPAISEFYISKSGPFGALPPKIWGTVIEGKAL